MLKLQLKKNPPLFIFIQYLSTIQQERAVILNVVEVNTLTEEVVAYLKVKWNAITCRN